MSERESLPSDRHIAIVGTARSGSTFIGHLIAQANRHFYMHEPFKYKGQLEAVKHHYPYAGEAYYRDLVDRFFAGSVSYGRRSKASDSPLARMARKLVRSRDGIRYRLFHLGLTRKKKLLVKDPFASLLSRYLIDSQDIAVVGIVRHPMAF